MAGLYPNVPSRRMAWDADGTVALFRSQDLGDSATEFSAGQRGELNDEDNTGHSFGANEPARYVWTIFPELREVDGFYASRNGFSGTLSGLAGSGDTTNGADGTWTQILADTDQIGTVPATYRSDIQSTAANSRRAIRLAINGTGGSSTQGLGGMHIYGTISAGETPDRLLWIDEATGLEFTASLDYGDVPRGSARDRGVRLKNNSASLTATTIQYTAEDLYLGSGNWYTFTTPGGAVFSATQQIASLGAGATTGLITARQVVPDAATLGLHAARAYTDVSSWS